MLIVTIDLKSALGSSHNRSLGTMEIDLIGGPSSTAAKTDGQLGDYRYRIRKWTGDRGVWKAGKAMHHNRKKRGPWDLLFRCLRDAVGRRNPEG